MRERTLNVVHQRVIDAPLRANEFSYQMRRCFAGSLESTCYVLLVKSEIERDNATVTVY